MTVSGEHRPPPSSLYKMEAAGSSLFVTIYQTTQHHIPEENNIN